MYSLVRPSGHRGDEAPWCVRSQMYSPFLSLAAGSPSQMAWISSEFCLTCVEIKFYGAFVLNRRVDLHAIFMIPARWRGDAGSSSLDGARTAASSPRNDLVKNCRVHPTHWLISTQSLTLVSPHLVALGVPSLSVCWLGTAQIWGSSRCVATDLCGNQRGDAGSSPLDGATLVDFHTATDEFDRQAVNLHWSRSVSKKLRPITVISCPPF